MNACDFEVMFINSQVHVGAPAVGLVGERRPVRYGRH
jgi:hypothetical protein